MRLRLRALAPFLDRTKRNIVYTDFEDELRGVREEEAVYMPKMTGLQYAKKVASYLRDHLNDVVILRLRSNQPLTRDDLSELEHTLIRIGEDDGETLLSNLLARSESPSLPYFVRSLVGMDRAAAQSAFSTFLSDRSLTPQQIRFIELIIDQLTSRGVMEASALYEPPFTAIHHEGPEALFANNQPTIEQIFETLKATQANLEAQAS